MNKKLLNKVMKKLASSNVVISPTVKSSSTSLSMQKKPETEQVQQKLEQYLLSRYHFRFNLLTEQTECCKKDADTPIYKVISQRTLNSLCLEARARHINCWDKDVSRFVNSEQMPDYHPLLSYMNTLPEWDGKDRVTPLAQRISTKDFWVNSFHRWMLGVTAQERTHGPVRQRCGPHAGEQRAREMQIHFLRIADARFVERLLYGQLRTDRTSRMRAEAGFLRTD
mgnify:CR=1 FL=1